VVLVEETGEDILPGVDVPGRENVLEEVDPPRPQDIPPRPLLCSSARAGSKAPTWNSGRRGRDLVLHVRTMTSFDEKDMYSPTPVYRGVSLSPLGTSVSVKIGPGEAIKSIHDDSSGCAAGVAVPQEFVASLDEKSLYWCYLEYDTVKGQGTDKALLMRVQVPSTGLDVITFAQVLPIDEPVMGRFMVGDCQSRLYVGPYAAPISLPLAEGKLANVAASFVQPATYSLAPAPTQQEIYSRFRASARGKYMYDMVIEKYKEAVAFTKSKAYGFAVLPLRLVSVFGFFVFSDPERHTSYSALASTLAYIGEKEEAKIWAHRALALASSQKMSDIVLL